MSYQHPSSSGNNATITVSRQSDAHLLFFVNSRSGSRQQAALHELIKKRFKRHRDCGVIFLDDFDGNETALQEKVRYEVYHHQSEEGGRRRRRVRAVACGGDGTVSWTFSLLKTAREEEEEEREETEKEATERGSGCAYCAPLGQLPMGTGNEFARVFGWNESKDRWESDFDAFCEEMKTGEIVQADLWKFVSESVVDYARDGEKKKARTKTRDYFSSSSSPPSPSGTFSMLRQRNAAAASGPPASEGNKGEEKDETKTTKPAGNNRRRRNWSFSGHLRSPSELEETLVESIRDCDTQTPHPSLPTSLFADPPLNPPGATTQMGLVQKGRTFVPPKMISEHGYANKGTTNPFVFLSSERVDDDGEEQAADADIESGISPRSPHREKQQQQQRKAGETVSSPLVKVEKFEKLSACFFSVGFDAGIALQFHQFREKTEKCCVVPKTVSVNVAGYGVLGALEWLAKRRYLSSKTILLYVDNKPVPIPERANTIQIFNIHSSTTGVDFFGSGEKSKPHERLQDFQPPSVQDGLVEVVATYGVGHLSAIRFRMTHSHRLAQGKKVEIVLKRPLPVQVDGEPWLNPPGRLKFTFSRSWPVVLGLGELRNVCPSPPPPPPPSKSASPSSSSPSSKHRGNHLDDEKQSKTAAAKRVIAPPPFGDEMV